MAILLITPKDTTDCNQLIAVLHSANIQCMNAKPTPIRAGVTVKTWTWESVFDDKYYIPSATSLAWTVRECGDTVQHITVNEFASLFRKLN